MMPKVSIIIPVYNGENFIKDAVESAIGQTYNNIEVIVVDDGSTDSTKLKLEPYIENIRYFYKENGGVSSALNHGISLMTGQFFTWLSHDDLFHKDKILFQIKYYQSINNPNTTVLFSNYIAVYQDMPFHPRRRIKLKEEFFLKKPYYSILRSQINGITVMIPEKLIRECGFFDETLRCTQDYDYWLRLLKFADFKLMNQYLAFSRVHKNQDSRTPGKCSNELNSFWTDVLNRIPEEVKSDYESSKTVFYEKFLKFLSRTPYIYAYNYHRKNFLKSK